MQNMKGMNTIQLLSLARDLPSILQHLLEEPSEHKIVTQCQAQRMKLLGSCHATNDQGSDILDWQ
jgi:hypothetical protein